MIETVARSVAEIVERLKGISSTVPDAAVVLGSGVNVLEGLSEAQSIPYAELFGIATTVQGHSGSLTVGKIDGRVVAVLRGRFHLFEGHSFDVVTLPTRVIMSWGIPKFFITNASGGLNMQFNVGDLMLLTSFRDHLNPRWKEVGLLPAVDAPAVNCENDLSISIEKIAADLSAKDPNYRALRKGTYAGLLGPTYETLAEIEMLRRLKADAVGMSTVPELLTAAGSKTKAAAISVVTNVWRPDVIVEGHEEVLRAAKEASQRLEALLRAAIA
jgi:purine-nucleoside phosphorylase